MERPIPIETINIKYHPEDERLALDRMHTGRPLPLYSRMILGEGST